ncbi:MAG: aspartate/glutamate racemase family protein [Candidatus ainarchaeum sp.]|nr:aspartate/glutamate racemase family protein [Candidatus ainarchaeum sp.]
MGPEATGIFYLKLIKRLQEKNMIICNQDFPQIIINSIPAKELVEENISKNDLNIYLKGLKELDAFSVDFIVMVCNTIYLFRKKLQKNIKTPIIDLKKEVYKEIIKSRKQKILVLGTQITIKKLYNFSKIKIFKPNKKEINIISKSIFLFNSGKNKKEQVIKVKNIIKKYFGKGAKIVILGCTELGVMLEKENIQKIDSIDVLVEFVIKKMKEEN